MAIPFLNNINLSDNELQNAKLHITGTAPTSADGQIYFDSSDRLAKYYSNGTDTWVSLKQYSFSNGTFINLSTATAAYAKDVITADLSATGTANNTTYLRGDNTWSPISAIPGTYTWRISDGGDATFIVSGDTVTFSGTTNEIEVAEASKTVTIGLPDDVTIGRDLTVTSTLTVQSTNQSSFAGQVTIPIIPVASTDAASKDYVDNAVVGGLVYQGGYNAATNTPDLDTSPSASIKKGWTYTVTADGLFFTEQVRVGDVIIAEVDTPTVLADWTTVQNNIDLASASQIGIGNVAAGTGISVSYINGTATVTNTDTNSSNTFAGDIGDGSAASIRLENSGATAPNINHGLGTNSSAFMIQLVDNATGETVYADVSRGAAGQVTITFATPPALDGIKVLIQKIG
jgi:hypothetical protein